MRQLYLILFILLLGTTSCGTTTDTEEGGPVLIVEPGMIFATPEITAPSGATIAILNRTDQPLHIVSQSAEDQFDDTGEFDILVPSSGAQVLTLPEAPSGTVFFYYDAFYTTSMTPDSGTITIE